jgi:glycosyltransferase involved in cell wall biosynthesis
VRVLHVTSTFPRATGDGTPPFVADLAAAERDAGLDVRVLAPHAPGLTRNGTVAGVEVRRFRYAPDRMERLAYGGGLLATTRTLRGAAAVPAFLVGMTAATVAETRRFRPDLVHAHWWVPGGLAASVAARLTKSIYVVTLHGSDVAIAHRRGIGKLATKVLRDSNSVVAVSDALAAEAQRLFGVEVGVAAMPVMVPDAPRPPRADGPLRLVAVGRFAPEKGFDLLLDAVARLDVDFTLQILGDGPLRAEMEMKAQGLPVTFPGIVNRNAYFEALRAADALVVPSRREGLGLVAVEAVLVGTPVIAMAVGGLPSVLAGELGAAPGGWLVAPGDVEGLAAALRRARELPAPGGAALEAAARHRPEAVAARHLELYAAALG